MTDPQSVLDEHDPRPPSDPMYIPWWAKGEYARKNGTTFRMRDGTTIVGGKIHVRGSGDFTPPPGVMWTGEVPPPDPRPAKVRKAPDAAQQLLAQHPTRDLRANLCDRFQLPHTILDGPNAGVVSMRLLNAIRKALK